MSTLPPGWTTASIGEITEPYLSIDPHKTPRTIYNYIDIGSIDNTSQTISEPKRFVGQAAPSRARRLVKSGDVLFSTVRTYLRNVAQVPPSLDNALASTGIAVLRPSEGIDARYLFHWLRSDDFIANISEAQDGTMYPAVRDKDVSSGRIPLPPSKEQHRIASKIDGLLARLNPARNDLGRAILLIERYKRAILTAAFDGSLVAGKRTASIQSVQLSELIDDGPTNGWSPKAGPDAKGALSLKLTATTSGVLRLDAKAVKRIYERPEENSKYWLVPGDLLVQRANTIEYLGSTAIFDGPVKTYIYPDLMMRLRINDHELRRYLWR
ncbi:MAG: hypothetical protein EOQ92_22970 [Mesorhizobium sp.]|uniref:restriction endonuclease subunit S n=1 Tax=Mesorhizobium sp. TaxID=1871066 RepID=UPI000FE9CCD4|nr:restriction endonuclease subunit S [Mesorhizobium sp.]RWI18630.1 MAG: hypothetical protein EOQ92_22970 [Mesorhizobium sp.]RWK93392.1 MAG: hypothetical protein EOR53_23585 [Mesorhizobium sp.]